MTLLVVYAALLLLAAMISGIAHRTVLSTAVLFLVGGFLLGGVGDVLTITPRDDIVSQLAELALFGVLFTDGMRAGWRDLSTAWRLPGRALGWGLPLTLVLTAVLAHYVVGLPWWQALLLGAVLAPTDPVLAAAIVGNERVPRRLRHLLNVESGVNDGLALPFVIILLSVAQRGDQLHIGSLVLELLVGVAIGVGVPLIAIRLELALPFAASREYQAISLVAIGLLVLGLGQVTHGNLFLAAFAAGVVVATVGEKQKEAFQEFGDLIAELLKLAALLVFGALISPAFLGEISWRGWVFAVLVLLVVRPIALFISFLGSKLDLRLQAAAMWFGPKGFASVVYGLLVFNSQLESADQMFHLVALTVALSIVAHSSTDVLVANRLGTDDLPSSSAERRHGDGRLKQTRSESRPSGTARE